MGLHHPPGDADARDRVAVVSPSPYAPLGRIVAVRERQKAMGFNPAYDAQRDIVEITGLIHSNLFDALRGQGEARKLALAKIGALALAALEREEEVERIRTAERVARELVQGPLPEGPQ